MPDSGRTEIPSRPARDRRPTLVVLRALGLGDLLTAVPALRALADRFPSHRRLLAAPRALVPLVELVAGGPRADDGEAARRTPAVHGVVHTAGLDAPLAPELSDADVAVDLHGRGPQSHRLLLASDPKQLLAFSHPEVPESVGAARWMPGEREVSRWCRLLAEAGIPADDRSSDIAAPPPPRGLNVASATVVHPGAASGARRWPAERFAAVARAERERGRQVVVTGSAGETGLAARVAELAGLPAEDVLAGRTDLAGLAGVVAAAGRVVCGDTGIAHLATALRTPSVVIFGPTSPSEWGPPTDRPWHTVLWAGSTGDPHAEAADPGLLAISAASAIGALEALPEPALPSDDLAANPSGGRADMTSAGC